MEEQLREKVSAFTKACEIYDIPDGRHEEVIDEYCRFKGRQTFDPVAMKLTLSKKAGGHSMPGFNIRRSSFIEVQGLMAKSGRDWNRKE